MEPTEDAFRALARSSPWRWRTLHFTYRQGEDDLEAWVRRPGQLLVHDRGRPPYRVDERGRIGGSHRALLRFSTGGSEVEPEPEFRWPHEVTPVLRPDGLVEVRPSDFRIEYGDPMYQSYYWVAVLDPVELSHHTSVAEVHETVRRGRRTWWARVRAEEGYDPTCPCCPLLWSEITYREDALASGVDPERTSGTVFPDGYDVGLDLQTGVVVTLTPVGSSSETLGHTLEILEVDADPRHVLPA